MSNTDYGCRYTLELDDGRRLTADFDFVKIGDHVSSGLVPLLEVQCDCAFIIARTILIHTTDAALVCRTCGRFYPKKEIPDGDRVETVPAARRD